MYYIQGHDEAFSMLSPWQVGLASFTTEMASQRPPWTEQTVPKSEITPNMLVKRIVPGGEGVRFYFGGVGDCRNVYTTILDIDHALAAKSVPVATPLQLELYLNDYSPAICARIVLTMDALYVLGQCLDAAGGSGKPTVDVLDHAAYVLHFVTSHVMPANLYDRMCGRMRELMAAADFTKLLPWLGAIDPESVMKIKDVFAHWLEFQSPPSEWDAICRRNMKNLEPVQELTGFFDAQDKSIKAHQVLCRGMIYLSQRYFLPVGFSL